MITFWQRSKNYTPLLVRLLAKNTARSDCARPLTDHEIALRGGLQPFQVQSISWNTDWHGIDLPTMQRFLVGCGIDFCNRRQMNRVDTYCRRQITLARLNRPNWCYLRRSPLWKTLYAPMMKRHLESLAR